MICMSGSAISVCEHNSGGQGWVKTIERLQCVAQGQPGSVPKQPALTKPPNADLDFPCRTSLGESLKSTITGDRGYA
jgi:hypothetical protein